MKKAQLLFVLLFCAASFGVTRPAWSDDDLCSQDVVEEAAENCFLLQRKNNVKKCLNKVFKNFQDLKFVFGKKIINSIKKNVTAVKQDLSISSMEADFCLDLDKIVKKVNSTCCAKEMKNERQDCLKKLKREIKDVKGYVEKDVYQGVLRHIRSQLKSKQCGQGGKEYTAGCEVMRAPGGGFLHKYPSDHGNVALLLPPYDSATACGYVTSTGEQLFGLRYYYRANGNRQHWRPYRGGYCGDFRGHKNVYARCTIRGRKNCWRIPDPCRRYE